MIGSVDARLRPLLRIEQVQGQQGILAVVNTGFNGELMLSRNVAAEFGMTEREGYSTVTLAGGQTHIVRRGYGTISWFARPRRIEVLIHVEDLPARLRDQDEPVGLVGTGLLYPHMLAIDFAARTLEVRQHA